MRFGGKKKVEGSWWMAKKVEYHNGRRAEWIKRKKRPFENMITCLDGRREVGQFTLLVVLYFVSEMEKEDKYMWQKRPV